MPSESRILITGAGGDMGRAVVKTIRDKTDTPIIVTRRQTGEPLFGSDIAEELVMDAANPTSVAAAGAWLSQHSISHFIQLHGHARVEDRLETQSYDALLYHCHVNVFSTIILLKSILPNMKARRMGRIVLMNTASSEHGGGADSFGYGLAKHSVGYLTKHLAKYFTAYNILTNCISPGFIETKFHRETMMRDDDQIQQRAKTVQLGRAGTPKELAEIIYFFCFCNDFISGENLKIDGADFI